MPFLPSVFQQAAQPHPSQLSVRGTLCQPAISSCCMLTISFQPTLESPPKNLPLNQHNSQPPSPLNRSSKNAKNSPRHSSLYSYPSWLPAALQAGKNITEETTYGVTTKTCQVKSRATLYYRSKKEQELGCLPLTFAPIFKSYSQPLRPASDQRVHCEVTRSAPMENKYFKTSLGQSQGFTMPHVPQGSLGEAKAVLHSNETQC